LTVNVAVFVTPPPDAEIVTVVGAATADVEMEKAAAAANAGTVTLDGTLATDGLLLLQKNLHFGRGRRGKRDPTR
jgi:hypothetical protein